MQIALPFSNSARPRVAVLGIALALALVAGVAAALPATGYALPAAILTSVQPAVLRLCLLALAYGLSGAATYRRSGDGWASGAALLFAGALGWAGWEWSALSFGWPIFAGLVLLLEWRDTRAATLAVAVACLWALVDPGAVWGVVLLATRAGIRGRAENRDRLIALAGAIGAAAILMARGVDLRATLFPAQRPWVWADGQVVNKLGDPIGVALFVGLLGLFGLWMLRSSRPTGTNLLTLAVFAYLTWTARRNGIWLALVGAPTIAAYLASYTGRLRHVVLTGAACLSAGLLLLALRAGPESTSGTALSAQLIAALPQTGTIVYRPSFEPALLQVRSPEQLALVAPGTQALDPETGSYMIWQRIAANCAPLADLQRLNAQAVVLDPHLDAATIASIVADPHWHMRANDSTAVVLVRS